MDILITRDTSKRVIEMNVTGVPVLDVSKPWHTKPKKIQPSRAVLMIVGNQTVSLKISGGVILGDSSVSEKTWAHWEWGTRMYGDPIGKAPDWVRAIWNQAPTGVYPVA